MYYLYLEKMNYFRFLACYRLPVGIIQMRSNQTLDVHNNILFVDDQTE